MNATSTGITRLGVSLLFAAGVVLGPQPLLAKDVVAVGCVSPTSLAVIIPVTFHDDAGTLLGSDRPRGERVAAMSFRVQSDDAAIESIAVERAGIFTAREPIFENVPEVAGGAAYIASFEETALPEGDVHFANLVVRLRRMPDKPIRLALDPRVTTLANHSGTVEESAMNESLELIDGCIDAARPARHRAQRP